MSSLGTFLLYDYWRTHIRTHKEEEDVTTAGLTQRIRSLRIPPHRIGIPGVGGVSTYVSLPVSGIERISVFVPVAIGFGIGFIAGMLGAGGGFILMPVLIYVLGIPTTVAIGTDLFQIIITGSVGSFAYALGDRVDPLMAALMLAAASIGSQLGASATRRVSPSRIRFLYGLLIVSGAVAVALEELSQAVPGASALSTVASTVLLGSGGGMCVLLLVLMARARRRGERRAEGSRGPLSRSAFPTKLPTVNGWMNVQEQLNIVIEIRSDYFRPEETAFVCKRNPCIVLATAVPRLRSLSSPVKVLGLVHNGEKLVVLGIFPALLYGNCLCHPRGGPPALFGGLVQVAICQILPSLRQEFPGLLPVIGHYSIALVIRLHGRGLAHIVAHLTPLAATGCPAGCQSGLGSFQSRPGAGIIFACRKIRAIRWQLAANFPSAVRQ